MIYLSTGANGSCKTLFTLKLVRELQLKDSRPVYYVADRFKPTSVITEEFGWKPFEFKDWQGLPSGSIILCDEVHRDLPKRPNSTAVPPHIQMIAEHRSRGFDFFMMTQHPSNLDTFVTKIIGAPGWHRHLKRVAGGSSITSVLQWDAVNNTCEKHGSGRNAQVTMQSQPKDVYKWYESAELHTAKVRIPKQVIFILVALPLIVALLYFAVRSFGPKHPAPSLPVAGSSLLSAVSAGGGGGGGDRARPRTAAEYISDYQPRFAGLQHTAPVYDKLTEPRRVPVPAACMKMSSKGCKCFTQDATPYPVDAATCLTIVANGVFLAFSPDGSERETARSDRSGSSAASAVPVVGPADNVLSWNDASGSLVRPPAVVSAAVVPVPELVVQRVLGPRR